MLREELLSKIYPSRKPLSNLEDDLLFYVDFHSKVDQHASTLQEVKLRSKSRSSRTAQELWDRIVDRPYVEYHFRPASHKHKYTWKIFISHPVSEYTTNPHLYFPSQLPLSYFSVNDILDNFVWIYHYIIASGTLSPYLSTSWLPLAQLHLPTRIQLDNQAVTDQLKKSRFLYDVKVIDIQKKDTLCEIDLNGFPLEIKFPTLIIKQLNLKKLDKFQWQIPDDGTIKASDCKLLARKPYLSEKIKSKFRSLLEEK